jgi:tyrosinase
VVAAQTLRQHYWNWASDPILPPAVDGINATARAPRGIVEIASPLRPNFQRPSVESAFGGFLATRTQTIRCLGERDMLSNITASNIGMASVADDLTSYVVQLRCMSAPRPSHVQRP